MAEPSSKPFQEAAGELSHDSDVGGTRERREYPVSVVLDFVHDYAHYFLAAVDSVAIINSLMLFI